MQAAQIEIKKEKGRLVVLAIGRTPRGVRYIKGKKTIAAKAITDKNFKHQMEAAVSELLGRTAYEAQYPLNIDNTGV